MAYKLLNTKEYLKEEKIFFSKFNEFNEKIIAINKEENVFYDNGTITDELIEKYENQRSDLKKEYGIYSSIYYADFYCWLTYKNINTLMEDSVNKKIFLKELKLVGKMVQSECHFSTYGILKGIAIMPDDVYYVIKDKSSGKEFWDSAVGGILPYNKWDHMSYKIVTTPDDKGYL